MMPALLAFGFALAACIVSGLPPEAVLPRVGQAAGEVHPQILLPTLDGKQVVALSRFRGRKLLLVQFASW